MRSIVNNQKSRDQVAVFGSEILSSTRHSRRSQIAAAAFGLAMAVSAATASSSTLETPTLDEPRMILPDSTAITLPTPRPDPRLMLPEAPASISLPLPRPDRKSLYPLTTVTLEEGYDAFTGVTPATTAMPLALKSGEGLAQLLGRGGFDPQTAQSAISRISRHVSMRRLPIGFEVSVLPAGPSHGGALRIGLDDDLDLTLIETADGWVEKLSIRPVKTYLTYLRGDIDTSLYRAAKQAGMSDSIFNTFVQVLSFSVDFQREIRKGDTFEALVEIKKDLITGKKRGNPELFFLSMTLSGDRFEFFRHEHRDGRIAWYDEAGNSAARTLMRTPINGARLSSGYGKRKHPVLGYSKMHRGVDFAAPIGTPIMAAGSGVVEFSGRNGSYGKYIRVRHNSTYKTAYAHLSRIGRGISPGARVSQGQIIGYVGNTGRSTGPHLHYEILVNDRKVNPMKVRLPAGKSIEDDERPRFAVSMQEITDELQARGILRFAEDTSGQN
ncbi:MAG: peptidoglycan DD-metalloendopeptidase family protein [Candidatus Puniceispirillales bacterium]